MGVFEDIGLMRCERCKSLKWPKEMRRTPTGRISKICQFCDSQARLERRDQYKKKPKPMITMIRNIEPELRKLEASMRFSERRTRDIRVKISMNISQAIRNSLKNGKKERHWETLVGYTISELINHLEGQFTEGMTWGNYGKWQIDHIIPIVSWQFESFDDIGFKRCWNYRNLRPLWAKENSKKGGKFSFQYQFDKLQELIDAIPEKEQ